MLAAYDDNLSEQGWWMGCGRGEGPACTHFKNVIMTVGFLKRLFATLPAMADELGLASQGWWQEVSGHLPRYSRMNVTVCKQGSVPPLPCFNTTRCPCTTATSFLMADSGTNTDGSAYPNKSMLSVYYSNWPVFPAEHIDADTRGDDGDAAYSGTHAMFATGTTSLAVLDWPAAVRMLAADVGAPPSVMEPGAQPVPILKGLGENMLTLAP